MTLWPSFLAQSTLAEKCTSYVNSVSDNLPASLHTLRDRFASVLSTKWPYQFQSLAHKFGLEDSPVASPVIVFLTVLLAFILLLAAMSWRSPFNSIFRRSPYRNASAPPQVSERDFSYITSDDIANPASRAYGQQYPDQHGGDAEPDILLLKHRGTTYPLHFPAYAIDDAALTVGQLRQRAAEATGSNDPDRIKLLYKGRLLKDNSRPCKAEGLKQQSEVLCVVSEVQPGETTPSDVSEGEANDAAEPAGEEDNNGPTMSKTKRRKKNKKKNNKDKQAAEASLSAPPPTSGGGSSSLPAPAPNLAAFGTPLEKANILTSYFRRELLPLCDEYIANPPALVKMRDFEYKKLSETILAQVILKADGIDPSGDEDARTARRALIKEAQATLNTLDRVPKE